MTNLTHNTFLYIFISFSTCFEHTSAHHQEIKLYQYAIEYMSFYVDGRPVCRFGRMSKPAYLTVTYIEWHIADTVLLQLNLLMMSTWMLETC